MQTGKGSDGAIQSLQRENIELRQQLESMKRRMEDEAKRSPITDSKGTVPVAVDENLEGDTQASQE